MNHPERAIQSQIVQLLRSIGGRVWELGTTRSRKDFHMGTRQTPGLPDVIAFLPVKAPRLEGWRRLEIECKAPGGRLRPEQREYRELTLAAEIDHLVGGLDDVIAWLVAQAYLKAENLPHYRQARG